jgi:hypothetical protein
MEGDEGMWDRGEDFGSEVKTRRGSGDRSGGLGIDGLVSFVIGFIRSALKVGRKGHVPVLFEVRRRFKLDDSFAFGKDAQNLGDRSGDGNANAGLELAAGSGEAFPFGLAERFEKKNLDGGRLDRKSVV